MLSSTTKIERVQRRTTPAVPRFPTVAPTRSAWKSEVILVGSGIVGGVSAVLAVLVWSMALRCALGARLEPRDFSLVDRLTGAAWGTLAGLAGNLAAYRLLSILSGALPPRPQVLSPPLANSSWWQRLIANYAHRN